MALLKGNWCWRSALCLFEHQTKLTGQAFVARYGGGLQPACRGVDRPVGTVSPPFSGSGPDAGGRPPPRLLSTTSYAGWPPAAALREAAAAACKVPGQASAVRHFHTAWSAGDRVVPDTRARNALSMTSLDDFTKRQRPQREFEVRGTTLPPGARPPRTCLATNKNQVIYEA